MSGNGCPSGPERVSGVLAKDNGLVTQNLQDDKFTAYLKEQTDIVGGLLAGLGLRKDQ